MASKTTSIKLEKAVRDRLKAEKRGGESYSQLIDKMVDQYDPDEEVNR